MTVAEKPSLNQILKSINRKIDFFEQISFSLVSENKFLRFAYIFIKDGENTFCQLSESIYRQKTQRDFLTQKQISGRLNYGYRRGHRLKKIIVDGHEMNILLESEAE